METAGANRRCSRQCRRRHERRCRAPRTAAGPGKAHPAYI